MVSNRSRYISDSTTDDDTGDMDYTPNNQVLTEQFELSMNHSDNMHNFQSKKPGRKPTRTPKCFSKNALTARENRLKKKVYMANLENQVSSLKNNNKKLSAIVENQSFMIEELKKEIKYLKSVISNSEGIGKLIEAIHSSTGMSVTSSLDKKLAVNNRSIITKSPIPAQAVPEIPQWGENAQSNLAYLGDTTFIKKHPWEEKANTYINYPTPDSTNSYYSNPEFDELNNDGLLLDLDIPIEMNNDELLGIITEQVLEKALVPMDEHNEHNYHNPVKYEQDTSNNEEDDVGVCLHVSKNKVSLEFCPSCSDNALQNRRPT